MTMLLAIIATLLMGITIAAMEYAGIDHGPSMLIGVLALFSCGLCVGVILARAA